MRWLISTIYLSELWLSLLLGLKFAFAVELAFEIRSNLILRICRILSLHSFILHFNKGVDNQLGFEYNNVLQFLCYISVLIWSFTVVSGKELHDFVSWPADVKPTRGILTLHTKNVRWRGDFNQAFFDEKIKNILSYYQDLLSRYVLDMLNPLIQCKS